MKKIPSLFKRDYYGDRQVYNEVVEGCEWVIEGEGVATVKVDGTACMVRDCVLYKRYDRKLTKSAARRKKRNPSFVPELGDFKSAPDGWERCEDSPDINSGHWPGWVPVGGGPEDRCHREAFVLLSRHAPDDTYELVGPQIQGNPYGLKVHHLWAHNHQLNTPLAPRTFDGIRHYLSQCEIEGIVWHHPDGRMCKIKRKDFGLPWPV